MSSVETGDTEQADGRHGQHPRAQPHGGAADDDEGAGDTETAAQEVTDALTLI